MLKNGMSVSLSKFHRRSAHSQVTNSSIQNHGIEVPPLGLPELRMQQRGLNSANQRPSPKKSPQVLKFYVHEAQCVFRDPTLKANRRYENQSEYVFVDTYLDALQIMADEEKKKFQCTGQTIEHKETLDQPEKVQESNPQTTFPNLHPKMIRERMKIYAQRQIQNKTVTQERVVKTSNSFMTQKIQPHKLTVSLSLHQNIPAIKHKISAKRWVMFVKKKGDRIFQQQYGYQEFQRSEMASITKIMTCYTTLQFFNESNIEIDQIKVKVPRHAECIDGTSADLNAGGILTIKQLLFGLMLPSGNDAAIVLSFTKGNVLLYNRHIKGLIIDIEYEIEKNKKLLKQTFLELMNKHAQNLKMDNTNYSSVHGLNDEKNVSCAVDISKLIEKCVQIDTFIEVISTRVYKTHALTDKGGKSTFYKWKNSNKLLKKNGWMGVKTGITPNAGPCFTGYYKNDNFEVIIVVLNCASLNQRFRDAEILLQQMLK